MKLTSDLLRNKTFTYGTHLPVIRSIMEVFPIVGVLELGVGLRSTPVFVGCQKKHVAVESEKEWYTTILGQIPPRKDFFLYHHNIGHGIRPKTKAGRISKGVKRDCFKYYRALVAEHGPLNLLFVDHVSGLRAPTVIEMLGDFDILLYHDAEQSVYGYDRIPKHTTGDHIHLIFRSLGVYTGILIANKYEDLIVKLEGRLNSYSREYCREFGLRYKHEPLKLLAS